MRQNPDCQAGSGRGTVRVMRTIVAVVLSLALGAASAYAENPPVDQGLEAGTSVSASFINIVYLPAKIVVAFVGGIAGGIAGVLTGGDQRAAYALWVPLMGGDYFVRPENLSGERPLAFLGSDYADQPSTWNGSATYAYDSLYN
jgi:hypothetical protein